ncbi:MAG: hypothetical protein J5662_01135 [Clostridia bacterium]|nr:hypothetical protein [Clostridia bacterium]
MLAFIALFFPAAAAVWLFEAIAKAEFSVKETLLRFAANALIINFLCILVKKFVFGTGAKPLYTDGDMTPGAAVTYITMALAFGLIITVLQLIFSKKIKITVEEKSDEEETK